MQENSDIELESEPTCDLNNTQQQSYNDIKSHTQIELESESTGDLNNTQRQSYNDAKPELNCCSYKTSTVIAIIGFICVIIFGISTIAIPIFVGIFVNIT